MSRYYEVDKATMDLFDKVRQDRFKGFVNVQFKLLMDSKLKINKTTGSITMAYIKKPNNVERYLLTEDNGTETEYFIFINDLVWEMASDDNKKRLLSHELRHAFIDEKGNFKTVDHEINDFYAEEELNKEEPRWSSDLAELVGLRYEQMKEDKEN